MPSSDMDNTLRRLSFRANPPITDSSKQFCHSGMAGWLYQIRPLTAAQGENVSMGSRTLLAAQKLFSLDVLHTPSTLGQP